MLDICHCQCWRILPPPVPVLRSGMRAVPPPSPRPGDGRNFVVALKKSGASPWKFNISPSKLSFLVILCCWMAIVFVFWYNLKHRRVLQAQARCESWTDMWHGGCEMPGPWWLKGWEPARTLMKSAILNGLSSFALIWEKWEHHQLNRNDCRIRH